MILQYLLYSLMFSYIAYKETSQDKYLKKNFCFIYLFGSIITLFNTIFNIHVNIFMFVISAFFIKFIYNTHKTYKIKSDTLNKTNVFYAVYKPKSLYMSFKGLFGSPVASSGIIVYENNKYYIFQFKLAEEYYQKVELKEEKIKSYLQKYIVIDTKFKINNLKEGWQKEVLSRKRVLLKGLWKFNCLRTASIVLNQIQGFEVKPYEFLTSIYFKRIMINDRKRHNK